jgi:hypothetical protein
MTARGKAMWNRIRRRIADHPDHAIEGKQRFDGGRGFVGITGRLQSEQVAGFDRNRWPNSSESAIPTPIGALV